MWLPTPGQVIEVHDRLIARDGGEPGVLWYGAIDAALHRAREGPFPVGDDLVGRTALLMRGLVLDHPFVDGNKRTAYEVVDLVLDRNDAVLAATNDAGLRFVLELARGSVDLRAIRSWLEANSRNA